MQSEAEVGSPKQIVSKLHVKFKRNENNEIEAE